MATTNGSGRWGRTSSTDDSDSIAWLGKVAPSKRMPPPSFGAEQKWPKQGCYPDPKNPAAIRSWFDTNSRAASFIRAHIAKGPVVRAGEAACWDKPYERFKVTRINHQEAYNLDGARVDMAEEHVSRLRRAETGIQPPVAGAYRLRYEPRPGTSVEAGENPRLSAPVGNVIIAHRAGHSLQDNRAPSIHQTVETVVDDSSGLAGMLSFICRACQPIPKGDRVFRHLGWSAHLSRLASFGPPAASGPQFRQLDNFRVERPPPDRPNRPASAKHI